VAAAESESSTLTLTTYSAGAKGVVFMGACLIATAVQQLASSGWELFGINLAVALTAIALSVPLSRKELRVTVQRQEGACILQLDDQAKHAVPASDARIELLVDAISLTVRVFEGAEQRGISFASRPPNRELEHLRTWLAHHAAVPVEVSQR
jgi:hypothetical protein